MSPISENDKRTWEDYISNFNSLSINFRNNKKDQVYRLKKSKSKKILLKNKLKLSRDGKLEPEGIIDLHGYRLQNAKVVLQNYILNAYDKNLRSILVITGKGYNNNGALRKEVPIWLSERILSNFLINFKTAPKNYGGEGALMVRIKNKNKLRFI